MRGLFVDPLVKSLEGGANSEQGGLAKLQVSYQLIANSNRVRTDESYKKGWIQTWMTNGAFSTTKSHPSPSLPPFAASSSRQIPVLGGSVADEPARFPPLVFVALGVAASPFSMGIPCVGSGCGEQGAIRYRTTSRPVRDEVRASQVCQVPMEQPLSISSSEWG